MKGFRKDTYVGREEERGKKSQQEVYGVIGMDTDMQSLLRHIVRAHNTYK